MDRVQADELDVIEDIEEILALEADGLLDLAPVTKRWLVERLDDLVADPSEAARGW